MDDKKILWDKILTKLKEEITLVSYQTWFENSYINILDDNDIQIVIRFSLSKKQRSTYESLIANLLEKEINKSLNIDFITEKEKEEIINELAEKDYNKEIIKVDNYEDTNLLERYKFENFVVGDSNMFAHSSAMKVAQNPGKYYNPLFIYGNSGLGKTHLMQAIGNYIVKNSNKKVLYVTSEDFKNDFVMINRRVNGANNLSNIEIFKKKYRDIDVLIIDDIQFLGDAKETQKEFFQTFTNLYNDEKQIIISSDSSPKDLAKLEDRLKTRFSWGLIVDIAPPDFELRRNIIESKIKWEKLGNIPSDVIDYIANNISGDVRSLEGAITRLLAYSTMMTQTINLSTAIEALKNLVNQGTSDKNNITRIQKIVAKYYKITVEDMKSKQRSSSIAYPRQVAMYLVRKHTDETLPRIGSEFGGRDHSTVIHAYNKITNDMKKNKELSKSIQEIEKDIV